MQSYQFSRCLLRGIYTEGICLVLCNDDGIVDTSLPNFVATIILLVFANQPKALVCNEGCHVISTTKTAGKSLWRFGWNKGNCPARGTIIGRDRCEGKLSV